MRKILLAAATIALLVFAWTGVFAMPVDQVPNPRVTGSLYVEDAGKVLGPEYIALIDGVSKQLEAANGSEMAVITVDNLEGTTVEDYAEKLFKRFGIGKKGKDNGILILLSRDDRKVRIEVGYGLEGFLNDAKAGRLLDENTIPLLKQNQFGRGLFAAAKAVAGVISAGEGTAVAIADPAAWPTQVEIPKPVEAKPKAPPTIKNPYLGSVYFLVFAIILGAAGFSVVSARVRIARAKAAKRKAADTVVRFAAIFWILGLFAVFTFVGMGASTVLTIVLFAFAAVSVTLGALNSKKKFDKQIAGYRLKCGKCGKDMDLLGEKEDDAFLSTQEIAEEEAGGVEYEIWKCPGCKATEKLDVTLEKAEKCPKCKRRTLSKKSTVILVATREHRGLSNVKYTCKNPGCGYTKEKQEKTAKLSSAGFGSSGSSSSGGSFGGGSSGGGGASRGF